MIEKHTIQMIDNNNEELVLNNFLRAYQIAERRVISIKTEFLVDRYFMTIWTRGAKTPRHEEWYHDS